MKHLRLEGSARDCEKLLSTKRNFLNFFCNIYNPIFRDLVSLSSSSLSCFAFWCHLVCTFKRPAILNIVFHGQYSIFKQP
jgi:hypothetical protein